ncbi:MAG: 50S ribosomal protein L17 [Candidatus Omnitrophica bacterium]|nr:50S ribosomal protein L17 [Candidatus Omnitrophota bacterium]
MRHRRKTQLLSRNATNRKALLRSLVRSLFIHERITTTYKKAKVASALADKIITMGKTNSITAKKNAISVMGSKELINKLFDDISPRFANRKGGYTRVLRLSTRPGDGATTAILELTERKIVEKKAKVKKEAKAVKEQKKPAVPQKEEKIQPEAEKAKPHIPPKAISPPTKDKATEERGREKAKSEQEKLQQGFLKGLRGYFRRKAG